MECKALHITLEEELYPIWEMFCCRQRISKDKRLKGLYAGILNKADGPDFQGAEFQLDGKIYRGDIEIHKQPKDWYAHGHHLDRRYDSVVLHLVWEAANLESEPVLNSKKLPVPTYHIKQIVFPAVKRRFPFENYSNNEMRSILKQSAIARLSEKARSLAYYCEKLGYDQAIYCMMLRIIGMPNNSNNFQRLADSFPWQQIQLLKHRFSPDLNYWIMLFFTCAGLRSRLPDPDRYGRGIPYPLRSVLPAELWQHTGQRPCNRPEVHLQALATFIHQFNDLSLCNHFDNLFKNRWLYESLFQALQRKLSIKSIQTGKRFWGRMKITEIIGNVLIPFFYYLSHKEGSLGFAAYLEEFFLFLPETCGYAKLDPVMKDRRRIQLDRRFYVNQGLLAIVNRVEPGKPERLCL